MKICILTTLHAPDDDRIFYKEALSIQKACDDVTIVAPHVESCENYRGSGIKMVALRPRTGWMGRFLMVVEAVRTVRRLKADVCHFHDFDLVPFALLLKRRRATRLIYDAHEAYPEQMLTSEKIPRRVRSLASRLVDWLEKWSARSCALVLTADDATRDSFLRGGVPAKTVFNYPPLTLFPACTAGEEERPEPYRDRPILLYQGTMSRNRGLFQMIDALAPIREIFPRVLLLLIGLPPSPLREEAEERVRALGLSDSVEVIPWVPHTELHRYIGWASVGLVPWQAIAKHKMNIPIKLFEYWACAVPVVASDLPSYRDCVLRARAGLLYDPAKTEDLASAIVSLLGDEMARREMGLRGQQMVQSEWNWDRMEEVLLACYRELGLGAPAAGRAAGA